VKLTIPFILPGLNEYTNAQRTHRQAGANMKRKNQQAVMTVLRPQLRGKKLREPVYLHYTWVEKSRRRDKDNITGFGHKVIQDALVCLGALRDDGWGDIEGYSDTFRVDKKNPHIEIEVEESGDG
jgi:Holliday junction resolvase RusA-like endonuclease